MPTAPGRRPLGWTLALLALAQLIFSLDLNIVFVALPEIGADLGFSGQTLQWVVGAYAVFAGGFLLFGGRAADLFGRRRVFVIALTLYALSSLAGGLATSPTMIIVARAVQGIGGALLLPSTLSLINNLFEEGPRRNKALAVWGGAGASGLTVGALLGGLLTEGFGWPAVFYVNVPLAGLVALAALYFVPRDERQTDSRKFDFRGALTVTVGATLLVYVLVQGPEDGWDSVGIIIAAVSAVILLIAFIVIEARSSDPLMPLRLFGNRSLVVGVSVTFVYMGTFGALPYFLTTLFQGVHGFSAWRTGLAFLVPSLAIATGTQLGGRIATRLGVRPTLWLGFGIGAVGTAALAIGFDVGSSYLVAVPGLIVSGVGQGLVWTAMFIAASSGVAPKEQGVANGMATTTLNLGYAIGLAVLIAVANAGTGGLSGDEARVASADGGFVAVLLAAAGMLLGLLITFAHPRASEPAESAASSARGRPDSAGEAGRSEHLSDRRRSGLV
jgi:EmrB/QacA subfamily drug resistance transporter